jgi:hypothetical protein
LTLNRSIPEGIENFILLTVDCLRQLEFYRYWKTMPKFAELLKAGFIVNASSNAPFTLASFPSIFTSSYPLEGDPLYTFKGRPEPLQSILRRKGYETAGFNANIFLSLISDYGRGFSHYFDPIREGKISKNSSRKILLTFLRKLYRYIENKPNLLDLIGKIPLLSEAAYSLTSIGVLYPKCDKLTLEAIEWIRRNKSNPFFLWIHYMDVHNPYLVGEDLKRIKKLSYFVREQELVRKSHEAYVKGERVEKGEVYRRMMEEIIKIYDRRITAVGNCIGKLILELRREGLDKGTALILTSDHGQGFLEHGLYSHGPYFYEEFLRVPMILGFLKGEGGLERINDNRSSIDIAPTVLSILGEGEGSGYRGRSILEDSRSPAIYSEALYPGKEPPLAIISGNVEDLRVTISIKKMWKKYIVHISPSGLIKEELYDLMDDPGEEVDICDSSQASLDDFRSDLLSHMSQVGLDFTKIRDRLRVRHLREKVKLREGQRKS